MGESSSDPTGSRQRAPRAPRARIEWAQLCELAFLDNCDRLCLIGVTTKFPVPSLPLAVHQLMIAARVVDLRPGEPLHVGVSIATPNRRFTPGDQPDAFGVDVAGEYVLITLRDVPLVEEGLYRFSVSLDSGEPVVVEIPVLLVGKPALAEIH